MNIVTKTYSGKYIVRPDTTLERNGKDFYPPEDVDTLLYCPVIFARVCKPGKSVAQKFASRYYDAVGVGLLLHPKCLLDGSAEGFACASCLDHTSILPFPLFDKATLDRDNTFIVTVKKEVGRKRVAFAWSEGSSEIMEKAIEGATSRIFIRTGDLVAIELAAHKPLCVRADGTVEVSVEWGGEEPRNFKIIY